MTYLFLNSFSSLNSLLGENTINVLSIGCGFSPEFFALSQWLEEKSKSQKTPKLNFVGVDFYADHWKISLLPSTNTSNTIPFSIQQPDSSLLTQKFDIVFLSRILSEQKDIEKFCTIWYWILITAKYIIIQDIFTSKKLNIDSFLSFMSPKTIKEVYYYGKNNVKFFPSLNNVVSKDLSNNYKESSFLQECFNTCFNTYSSQNNKCKSEPNNELITVIS